jgi:hypothetical protein
MLRGQSLTISGTARDADGDTIDLSAATVTWRAAYPSSRYARLTKTGTGNASGVWSVTLDPADTEQLPAGDYNHGAEYVVGSTTGNLINGRLRIESDINTAS